MEETTAVEETRKFPAIDRTDQYFLKDFEFSGFKMNARLPTDEDWVNYARRTNRLGGDSEEVMRAVAKASGELYNGFLKHADGETLDDYQAQEALECLVYCAPEINFTGNQFEVDCITLPGISTRHILKNPSALDYRRFIAARMKIGAQPLDDSVRFFDAHLITSENYAGAPPPYHKARIAEAIVVDISNRKELDARNPRNFTMAGANGSDPAR